MLVLFGLALAFNVSAVSAAGNSTNSTLNQSGATPVSPQVTYTPGQVDDAATTVKNYYDTNHALPSYVTINSRQVTMPQFLQLLTYDITQSNSGSTEAIILKNISGPSNPTETVRSGTLTKTEYLNLAQTVKSNIDSTGLVPDFANSSLGKIRFESLVYIFSKTMNFHDINNRLPNTLSVTPWTGSTTEGTQTTNNTPPQNNGNQSGATPVIPQVSYTPSQINAAATSLKNFYDTNHRLPGYVTINGIQVTMPQFLQLLTYDITQTNSGSLAAILLKNVSDPSNPTETVKSGTLTKTEYVSLAQTIKSSIDSTGTAPGSVNSSLGQMRFESLVYIFSKTMSYYATNNRLPNTLSVTPWASTNTPVSGQTVAQIMTTASKFGYSSLSHDAAGLVKYGSGDCWAMSDYLYKQFTAAGIRARILQYATAYASNHRSVQYMVNGSWVDAPYRQYFSTSMFNNTSGTAGGAVIADNKL